MKKGAAFLHFALLPFVFTDTDLSNLLKNQKQGAIYVWSPGMPLSRKGADQIEAMAKLNHFEAVILREETLIPERSRCTPKCDPRLKSEQLISKGATRHFPTLFIFKNHQLLEKKVPGYQTEHELRQTLTEFGIL